MVLESILGPFLGFLVGFVVMMAAAYAGTLRALEVYDDPWRGSIFLSDDHDRSGRR